jgi:enoyl-CoA hydratase/carnithine racemase
MSEVTCTLQGRIGLITLNRPKAMNALSLGMVRAMSKALVDWAQHPGIDAVLVHGAPRVAADGRRSTHFCAGGDIRFFHAAALAGDPALEDFFTEEYALNHLIHHYPKPYISLLQGVCMGGGMGIAGHGAAHAVRVVSPSSKLAMPETHIGLFPDVGGGWFLARCPGHMGEWLALTGDSVDASGAMAIGWADAELASDDTPSLVAAVAEPPVGHTIATRAGVMALLGHLGIATQPSGGAQAWLAAQRKQADHYFGHDTVCAIVQALEAAEQDPWALATAATLRQRSPLMCEVTLAQVRRARHVSLADALRLERDLVRHSFFTRHLNRSGAASETVEGIRALAVDKDHQPRWNPPRLENVSPDMVAGFFESPWPPAAHPLVGLA